ncbi:aldo/keto reductase [Paenibacillus aceris]|uniref:Aryl-alcohol dehydrogenase-like predicted oxidoreductase n=1 Tax=Paenibacillus aceris TaxID=869555 RepID=A0ABS4HYY3_9BACL|nr:aldo/keto reductase [Paenibacillus aceris]MBP1963765.1 aryl-alcohol dehydrogenase-like predicted oxidoreductase [Paenibacillus aceris]NHW37018.1 aldo/keto reductase [Paenibacillus aceris]
MEKRLYGKTGMQVSVLGFGGAEIGFSGATPETVDQLLGSALDAGLNVIDTAECYNISEELIGKTVSHRRDDYYLFTKCGHAAGFDLPDWDPKLLEQSIDRSLKRLNTDYVDVIHLHSCSEEILRRGDVIEVLLRAKEQGKTRFIGYSGDHKAALYAVQSGLFDSLETSINIADQEAIELTIPEAIHRGMGVVVKRPIANAAWKTGQKPTSSYHHTYWDRLQQLKYDFLQAELNESVEIALRFTLSVPGVHTAIVGTTNPDRWLENAKLLEQGNLSKAAFEAIRAKWLELAKDDWIGQG